MDYRMYDARTSSVSVVHPAFMCLFFPFFHAYHFPLFTSAQKNSTTSYLEIENLAYLLYRAVKSQEYLLQFPSV